MKFLLILTSILTLVIASFWPLSNGKVSLLSQHQVQDMVPVSPIPVLVDSDIISSTVEGITAETAFVVDIDSGTPLFEKNSHKKWFPASTTKLMTALVARNVYAQQETLVIGQEVYIPGNTIDLSPGSEFKISELLYGLLVASGNDVAQVLAAHHPGGYQGFIDEMNELARELKLNDTFFENPSGLDSPNQYSSARDLAMIGQVVYLDPLLRPIVSTKNYQMTDIHQVPVQMMWNTNELLGSDVGVVGGKTGTTEYAGQVLVSLVDRDGRKLVVVVMGSEDRYSDTKKVIEAVYKGYSWINFDDI